LASNRETHFNHRNLKKLEVELNHGKLKTMGGKVPTLGMCAPAQYIYRILWHGKFGLKNSIYDMKWGAHTWGTFSPFVLLLHS
jgi:hypothetical protein